jgi:mono/diheme cytochrome c family protein
MLQTEKGPAMNPSSSSRAVLALTTILALSSGCAAGDEPGAGDGPTWARDVQPLVAAKCATCHTEGGIAPFPLQTYEQVKAMKGAVASAVTARTMPPWMASPDCTDYRGDFSLTDAQIDTIAAWVSAGAPEGDPGESPVVVEDDRASLSRVDMELPVPVAYTPKSSPDDYRCFLVDWPASETTYVTGFGAVPGNAAIVHHVIAFIAKPDNLATYEALDAADAEPGWACFGGPGGEAMGPSKVAWLGGWAPGGTGQDVPAGTGIEVPVGSKLIVQVHYNTATVAPAPDQTKIVVRTDASVEKKAAVMPFANVEWLLGGMPIPAHAKDVVHTYSADPSPLAKIISGGAISGDKPLTIHAAGPHMHGLGTRILAQIDRADGTSECMMDIPRWNFHWQLSYNFQAPKQLGPGDKVHLECHWDNPGNDDVNWGEGTSDEMCLGVLYVTE